MNLCFLYGFFLPFVFHPPSWVSQLDCLDNLKWYVRICGIKNTYKKYKMFWGYLSVVQNNFHKFPWRMRLDWVEVVCWICVCLPLFQRSKSSWSIFHRFIYCFSTLNAMLMTSWTIQYGRNYTVLTIVDFNPLKNYAMVFSSGSLRSHMSINCLYSMTYYSTVLWSCHNWCSFENSFYL